jgi:hypothetical protein
MKYSLRSLVIATIFIPPVLAGLRFVPVETLAVVVIPLLTCLIVHLLIVNHRRSAR